MITFFHFFSFIAIVSTVFVIFQSNPIYSLLYLILSFLSISGVYFSIGEIFVGSLETIIYAGAIMVLFIFVMMMLNLSQENIKKEQTIISKTSIFFPFFLVVCLFSIILYGLHKLQDREINFYLSNIKNTGIILFQKYLWLVEFSSMILLAALIISFHFCINKKK